MSMLDTFRRGRPQPSDQLRDGRAMYGRDGDMTRAAAVGAMLLMVVVSAIEFGATYASLDAAALSPVEDWGPTRATDWVSFVIVAIGCLALFALRRYPATVTVVSALSYCAFILRDYEFGMSLPVMVAIGFVASRGHRAIALIATLGSVAASLVWVARRAGPIEDGGISMLTWVAFATVLTVFFVGPLVAGEFLRLRRALRVAQGATRG